MATMDCLRMATRTNRIDKIVTVSREVHSMTDTNLERDSLNNGLLACCATN